MSGKGKNHIQKGALLFRDRTCMMIPGIMRSDCAKILSSQTSTLWSSQFCFMKNAISFFFFLVIPVTWNHEFCPSIRTQTPWFLNRSVLNFLNTPSPPPPNIQRNWIKFHRLKVSFWTPNTSCFQGNWIEDVSPAHCMWVLPKNTHQNRCLRMWAKNFHFKPLKGSFEIQAKILKDTYCFWALLHTQRYLLLLSITTYSSPPVSSVQSVACFSQWNFWRKSYRHPNSLHVKHLSPP